MGSNMRGAFDDEPRQPVKARRDTELTLGSGMLMVLFLGLIALCGFCFGAGYVVGHRGPETAPVAAQSETPAAQPNGSQQKPAATTQAAQAPPDEAVDADEAAAQEPAGTMQPAETQDQSVQNQTGQAQMGQTQTAPAPAQPQVRPAFAGAAQSSAAAQPAPSTAAQPAAGTLMVQIAAVSNAQDADVLTNALRKRGYAVTEKRDPVDNMIHVRIGPFATAAEADSWKRKLLSDGYNAEVQP